MPTVQAGYLVPFFIEAGMYSSNGNGISTLSWTDIHNWLSCTERRLELWEKKMIQRMSSSYVAGYYEGRSKTSKAPYQSVMTQERLEMHRKAVASSWKARKAAIKEENN